MRSLKELTKQVVKPVEENKQQSLFETSLIKHEEAGEVIYQRLQDGYVNATAMCKACGKEMREYNRLPSTKEFKEELSRSVGIPTTELSQLIQVCK